MNIETDTVRTADGNEWQYSLPLPETLEEAVDTYGEVSTLNLVKSALKVKIQGIAREMFRNGKNREEVEESVKEYKPGATKKSKKMEALELVTDNAAMLQEDPDLKSEVQDAFAKSEWERIKELLS